MSWEDLEKRGIERGIHRRVTGQPRWSINNRLQSLKQGVASALTLLFFLFFILFLLLSASPLLFLALLAYSRSSMVYRTGKTRGKSPTCLRKPVERICREKRIINGERMLRLICSRRILTIIFLSLKIENLFLNSSRINRIVRFSEGRTRRDARCRDNATISVTTFKRCDLLSRENVSLKYRNHEERQYISIKRIFGEARTLSFIQSADV